MPESRHREDSSVSYARALLPFEHVYGVIGRVCGAGEPRAGGVKNDPLKGVWSGHEPDGQHDDGAQQAEHAVHGDADEPKRNQQEPHERVEEQGQQGQGPAEDEEDAPEEELDHIRAQSILIRRRNC